MEYSLFMDISHASQDLLHIAFDIVHRDPGALCNQVGHRVLGVSQLNEPLFRVLDHFFKVSVAEFKHQILGGGSILAPRVKDIKHFDDILAVPQPAEDFVFP